ncbi:MAG: hypothetical protein DRQ39_03515 [Gammaproteobacteria bacterium]|nr:MAG: hypothetical protein DRQ39_03515 [Gammaproteobacteria bacterium]
MNDLPKELLDELGGQLKDDRKYTIHDHVLAKINAHPDGVTVNDLMVYLFFANDNKLTKREYLYHVLSRLRKKGLIHTKNSGDAHGRAMNLITEEGAKLARPTVETPGDGA